MSEPQWREVPGWEGLYAVSDDGQVKSLPRHRRKYERLLKPARESGGRYWYVTLYCRGRERRHARLHALVLEAFVGPRPPGLCGLHADDDPDNNTLANLRWGTLSENNADQVRNGNHSHARKTHCKWGHPFSGDNLLVAARGQRVCRTCAARATRKSDRRRAARRSAARKAGKR